MLAMLVHAEGAEQRIGAADGRWEAALVLREGGGQRALIGVHSIASWSRSTAWLIAQILLLPGALYGLLGGLGLPWLIARDRGACGALGSLTTATRLLLTAALSLGTLLGSAYLSLDLLLDAAVELLGTLALLGEILRELLLLPLELLDRGLLLLLLALELLLLLDAEAQELLLRSMGTPYLLLGMLDAATRIS